MDIFSWLFLGHLLGDWLLQNRWMARGKKEGLVTLAGMVHFSIYTIMVTAMLLLSGNDGGQGYLVYPLVASTVFVSHWLIDASDIVARWIEFYGQDKSVMMRVMVDQTFHIVVLASLAVTLDGYFLQ